MKKKESFIRNYLWILPFFSFLTSYFALHYYTHVQSIILPSFIGKNIHEILPFLSQYNLNLRLLAQKEEPAFPEGTILRQVPAPGQKVKPHQPIFLVTTKKRPPLLLPDMLNKAIKIIKKEQKNTNIRFKMHYLPNDFPQHHCFSQSQAPGHVLEDNNHLILYISAGNNKPIIWPNFTQYHIEEVIEFLASYHIKPHIITSPSQKHSQIFGNIIEQQPLAGSLITLNSNNPLCVQLRVQ